jgi:phospholipase A1
MTRGRDFRRRIAAAIAGLIALPGGLASATPQGCRDIVAPEQRLECYDQAARMTESAVIRDSRKASILSDLWDISEDQTRRVLKVRAHRVNYFLPFRHSASPDVEPWSPTLGGTRVDPVSQNEAKFQISIKSRLLQGLMDDRLDVWLGYSQQAHWQIYSESSPFREVNFEPEVMAVWRTAQDLPGGWQWRFVNFGLVHQSNGRGGAASRSWNRVYAQFGIDHGPDLAVLLRPWWRLPESARNDNNPDVVDYVGRMDATLMFRTGALALELTLRSNLDPGQPGGALQFNGYLPLYRGLKGYLQVFSGYGESLIDYNHRQTTVGLGFALVDWM